MKGSDADGSVVIRHVRVGHLQGFIKETASDRDIARGFCFGGGRKKKKGAEVGPKGMAVHHLKWYASWV